MRPRQVRSVSGGQRRCGRLRTAALPNPPRPRRGGELLVSTLGTVGFFSGGKKEKKRLLVSLLKKLEDWRQLCACLLAAERWWWLADRGTLLSLCSPPRVQMWSPSPGGRGRNWEGVASAAMEAAKERWELQQGLGGLWRGQRHRGKRRGSAWPGGHLRPRRGSGLSPGQDQPAPELRSWRCRSHAFQSCLSLVCPCGTWCCSSPPPQRHRAGGHLCSAPEHLTPPRTSLAAWQAASLLQTTGAPSEPSEGDSSSRRPPARARRHSAQGELKKIGIFIQM